MTNPNGFDEVIERISVEVERKTEIAVTIGILKRLFDGASIELAKYKAQTVYGRDILAILRFLVIAMEDLQKEELRKDRQKMTNLEKIKKADEGAKDD